MSEIVDDGDSVSRSIVVRSDVADRWPRRTRLAIDPTDASNVYITGALYGFFLASSDGGQTWISSAGGINGSIDNDPSSIALDPAQPAAVYVGARAVYKSTDRGRCWTWTSGSLALRRHLGSTSRS